MLSSKADLSIMLWPGQPALPWDAEHGTTEPEGITATVSAGAPCLLLGSVNQEGRWQITEDSVKSHGNYWTVSLSICFSVGKNRAQKSKMQS